MEQETFKTEILPLRGKLAGYARRLLDDPDEVDDVMQEVFLKLWYIRDQLDRYREVGALAMQITKHLCLNRIRVKERLEGEDRLRQMASDQPAPDRRMELRDSVGQVMRIMQQLPDLQQTVLRMKHVEGFEVEEIAALTGSSPEAVRMNLSRARKRVKNIFMKWQNV